MNEAEERLYFGDKDNDESKEVQILNKISQLESDCHDEYVHRFICYDWRAIFFYLCQLVDNGNKLYLILLS